MTYRRSLTLGLLIAASVAMSQTVQAADGKPIEWQPGAAPSASGSAEEAAQLARQATELAARAAAMAADAQNQNAAKPQTSVAPAATASAATPIWKGSEEGQGIIDIRFRKPAATEAESSSAAGAPLAAAGAVSTKAAEKDDQVQLAARTYTDSLLLTTRQEETPPGVSPTPPASSAAPDMYQGQGYIDECCPPQRVLFWTGGVEATFLSPDLNSDGVTFQVEEFDDSRDDLFTSQSNDVDSLYMSPRAWIGIQGCLWGANLRYWHLQASEGTFDPTLGSLGGWDDFDCGVADVGYFTASRLEAYTVDLEVTRRFCLNDCWMQASFGLRHAEIENSDAITGLAITDEGLLAGYARANRMSRGTGILFGLYGRKPLYPSSCVHWFYNARWSAVWGPTQTAVETHASVQSNDPDFTASAASINGAYTNVDDTLFIGEIQLGLEWNYALQCLPANAFCRFALEYQRWDGGRGYSAANSFAGITIDGDITANAVGSTTAGAGSPQMDLLGVTFGTGLTW